MTKLHSLTYICISVWQMYLSSAQMHLLEDILLRQHSSQLQCAALTPVWVEFWEKRLYDNSCDTGENL